MAKEDARQKALRRGMDQLRNEGLSIEDLSPAVIGCLKDQIGKGTGTDLAAIFLLGRIADSAAVEALISLEESVSDRGVKREIRRSLFKLGQRGLEVPQRETVREAVENPVSSFAPGSEAYMSPVDGSGSRMVWLTKGQAGSGLALLQGVVNDRDGLMQASGGLLRRKELRRMISEMKEKHGFTMVPVPWAYVDNLLYEAYEKAKGTGRPGLEQFTSLRSHISSAKPEQRPHPVYDHFKWEDVLSSLGRESSQGLLEEPEFRSWVLEEDWIKPYLEQLRQAQESRLVLNPAQKEERMGSIVRGAIQEIFSGEVGTLMVGRMEDMALILALTGREDRARLSLAVALTLKEEKIGGLGPGNPFLEGLVQKTMSYYVLQEQEKEKEKESSLLIKP